ncbi:NADH dehydrogenase [ubiquinone] 1 alpha subcomplex assembly factor 3 [Neocloeon triangulifer]|uniref:NADH dehydrogenase [ubiquinone] 1 alpha subcomplex assembly factor 3 n=1 Tax=Neocloeon triangulifer TaxID=2078957 RepID=UPI00286EFAC2|nr:NADH dehydrogenase [ubiquinone] 1 alpha subcomplex assembly factor 3 [Neocloeon triangulifer]
MNICSRRLFHSISRCLRMQRRQQITKADEQQKRTNYDGPGRTTVSFSNEDSDVGLLVDSYSQIGFRLSNGVFVVGPVALFPRSVLSWNVAGMDDITPKSLQLFFSLDPKIDILVLGMGDEKILDHRLMKEIKRLGLNVEALPTDRACATFNFLNSEFRYVAAALIPPENVRASYEDMYELQGNADKINVETLGMKQEAQDNLGGRDLQMQKLYDKVNDGLFPKRFKGESKEEDTSNGDKKK